MSLQYRKVKTVIEPKSVMEGAGVKLKRSLDDKALNYLDPFLLFDHFGSSHAEDYQAGHDLRQGKGRVFGKEKHR